jgi:hypothetical protein
MDSPPVPTRRFAPPPPPRAYLHTFSDGSILRKISARDLVKIPIWKGNRILNQDHKQSILQSLKQGAKSLDLKPFHVISYPVEAYESANEEIMHFVVDGQHRLSILKESDALDFDVLVVEKKCDSESDVIEYFKILNHTRAIEWKEDPIILANRYIVALEKVFNTGKEKRIRPKATHRPYLYVDTLREELVKRKIGHTGKRPEDFAEFAKQKNQALLEVYRSKPEQETMIQRALDLGFCLALDPKFKWLSDFE